MRNSQQCFDSSRHLASRKDDTYSGTPDVLRPNDHTSPSLENDHPLKSKYHSRALPMIRLKQFPEEQSVVTQSHDSAI